MDLALRVLFHRFQIIFDRIRLTFSVAVGTSKINIKCITAVSTVNIPKPRRSCSWTYKINKLLVSPNERLNNITLERTIEYNTTQPQNSTTKESNATSEIESTWKERPKSTWPTHCSNVRHKLSHVSVTVPVYGLCRDMPLQKLSGVAIFASLQECVFSSLLLNRRTATWNLFVNCKVNNQHALYTPGSDLCQNRKRVLFLKKLGHFLWKSEQQMSYLMNIVCLCPIWAWYLPRIWNNTPINMIVPSVVQAQKSIG